VLHDGSRLVEANSVFVVTIEIAEPLSSGHNTGQDARDSDPKKKALGIAVHNDRPQRRYSGLLASLRSDGGQAITATAPDGISKRTQPH